MILRDHQRKSKGLQDNGWLAITQVLFLAIYAITNSKATLRLSMKDLLPLIPGLFHEQLRSSRYYAERSNALVIQADGSRRQTDNIQECHKKLEDLLLTVGRNAVRGESTPSQIAKVKKL
ncbi:MAG: hypothetical protein Q9187_000487 [Circinaria calcarea]